MPKCSVSVVVIATVPLPAGRNVAACLFLPRPNVGRLANVELISTVVPRCLKLLCLRMCVWMHVCVCVRVRVCVCVRTCACVQTTRIPNKLYYYRENSNNPTCYLPSANFASHLYGRIHYLLTSKQNRLYIVYLLGIHLQLYMYLCIKPSICVLNYIVRCYSLHGD